MIYNPDTDELIFPAGAIVVAMTASSSSSESAAAQGTQRFFVGHTAFVCCLAVGGRGSLLATGQEGKQAVIRVWDFGQQQQQQQEVAGPGRDTNAGSCLAVLCGKQSP